MKGHEGHEGHEENPTNQGSETPADLASPASPGAMSERPATDKTKTSGFVFLTHVEVNPELSRKRNPRSFRVLSGRGSHTHRLAAAGGRQVSAAFMSFMIFMSFMCALLLASRA
jgi:hypothetical protein